MFKLPDDFPLEGFVGLSFVSVVFAPHCVDIHLSRAADGKALIRLEGPAVLSVPGHEPTRIENDDLAGPLVSLNALVGLKVTSIDRISDCTIRARFDGGAELELMGEEGGFEFYHLRLGTQHATV